MKRTLTVIVLGLLLTLLTGLASSHERQRQRLQGNGEVKR